MGQKKKQPQQDLLFEMTKMMVPKEYLEYFSVYEVRELKSEWQIILHEKETLIPDNLKDQEEVVLDGYCKPLQVLSHCFSLKPVYIVVKRRRWKQSGTDIHYSNTYTLTKDSAKLTNEMAGFLKI
jgi:hypothetical protein